MPSSTVADPFDVPRSAQGAGRHDDPDRYTAIYASRSDVSAVVERLQAFRGQALPAGVLRRPDGRVLALASFDIADDVLAMDLDDPAELVRSALRPSMVATRDRSVTRPIAIRIFDAGAPGFLWWSTLEASWSNATLFGGRFVTSEPPSVTVLDPEHPAVREACEFLGLEIDTGIIRLPVGGRRRG